MIRPNRILSTVFILVFTFSTLYSIDKNPVKSMIKLTSHNAKDYYPAWSPDGQKIAFASERSGNRDIWIMNIDTKVLKGTFHIELKK